MKTVNDFITGYCDALNHVDMLGSHEVVDLSNDEDREHNTKQYDNGLNSVLDLQVMCIYSLP